MKQFNFNRVKDDFKNKLVKKGLKEGTISSKVSRIERINKQRDILKEYDRDGCVSLLEDLDFTKEDQQNGREPIIDIPVGSDYAKGFASLKSALNSFVEFLNKSRTQYEPSNISDSPIFIGSFKDFNRYIGPACRNCVQNICRAERKKRKGVCEGCGFGNKELQSAHIEDRPEIIRNILINITQSRMVFMKSKSMNLLAVLRTIINRLIIASYSCANLATRSSTS